MLAAAGSVAAPGILRAQSGFPEPPDPHRRAGGAGRRRRHLRAPDCRQGQDPARRSVHRRKPHRRQLDDRRPRGPARRAGWPHGAVPRLDPQRREAGAEERALRSGYGFHADRGLRRDAARSHHRQQPAGENRRRDRRRRQGRARQMVVRHRPARRTGPSRRRRVQPVQRPQRADHSLSRHSAGGERRGRRSCADDDRGDPVAAPAREGRQRASGRGDQQEAKRRSRRRSRR